jgi:hypothetical protein
MKKINQRIRDFRAKLDDMFEDKFVVKADNTNRLISKFTFIRNKLYRRLWYD